jgi:hypothetical protein
MQSTAVPIIPSLQPAGPAGNRVKNAKSNRRALLLAGTQHKKHLAFNYLIQHLSQTDSAVDAELISNIMDLHVSQKNPQRIKDSEKKLRMLFENTLYAETLSQDELVRISISILKLRDDPTLKNTPGAAFSLDLLNKIITQRRIAHEKAYVENQQQIEAFSQVYKLTITDVIFRYAIGFNAGLGSGSVIYGIATAILLNPVVMAVSGGFSLLACVVIANYFLKSYNEEDEDLTTKLHNFQKTINFHSMEEGILRMECYDLINQMSLLAPECKKIKKSVTDYKSLIALHKSGGYQDPLAMDKYINGRLAQFSKENSTVAQVNNLHESKQTSIFTRIFHSRHWGPVLNFFGASGTLFGVTKTILAVAGVTALMGSPMTLMALVAGSAIVFSIGFAYKHWRFNKLSEKRKAAIKDFEIIKMDGLTINTDKLKKLRMELQTNLTHMQREVDHSKFEETNFKLAQQAKKITTTRPDYQPASPTASPSNGGFFANRRYSESELSYQNDFPQPRAIRVAAGG